ncbi:MAG: hypothetical protein IPP69_07880 [Flavobacteriales bacterium]|nr:hypothetical protein [Flavobacteriales bacterium]
MQEIHDATAIDGSIIFVDDLRCFVGPQPFDSGECYPNVTELIDLIRSRRPGYYITIHDDTLIAVPGNLREVIDADWVANYRRRFPNTLSNRIDKWWWRIKISPSGTNTAPEEKIHGKNHFTNPAPAPHFG